MLKSKNVSSLLISGLDISVKRSICMTNKIRETTMRERLANSFLYHKPIVVRPKYKTEINSTMKYSLSLNIRS